MEIRPILSAMARNMTGSVLVALQIALTLAIVVNCMFMAKGRIDFIARPSGMDIENIVTAQSIGFGNAYEHDATIEADLRLLRELPGVVAVTSTSAIPMGGSGSASGFKASMDEDAPRETANYFYVGDFAAEALGVNIIEGRGFTDLEVRRSTHELYDRFAPQVVITKAYADALFPDGGALGSFIYNSLNEPAEVIGIVETLKHQLDDVNEAVTKLDDGSYGTCHSCGKEIGAARMEARPFSLYCVDCKTRRTA